MWNLELAMTGAQYYLALSSSTFQTNIFQIFCQVFKQQCEPFLPPAKEEDIGKWMQCASHVSSVEAKCILWFVDAVHQKEQTSLCSHLCRISFFSLHFPKIYFTSFFLWYICTRQKKSKRGKINHKNIYFSYKTKLFLTYIVIH